MKPAEAARAGPSLNRNTRPLSVTVLACLYVVIGVVGFAYHLPELLSANAFRFDALSVELTELFAVLSGLFLLRGHNWARWAALAWIAFHVILSAGSIRQFFMHAFFCIVIGWILFRPDAARYFRPARIERT